MQAKILREQIGKRRHKQRRKDKQQKTRLAFHYEANSSPPLRQIDGILSRTSVCSNKQRSVERSEYKSSHHFINRNKDLNQPKDTQTKTIRKNREKNDNSSENRTTEPRIICLYRNKNLKATLKNSNQWLYGNNSQVRNNGKLEQRLCKGEVSPLDLLILAAENVERSVEVKSENSEAKNKTTDELKESSLHSFSEDVKGLDFHIVRTSKLVLESPK